MLWCVLQCCVCVVNKSGGTIRYDYMVSLFASGLSNCLGPPGYLKRSVLTSNRLCNNSLPIHITFANGERAEARGIGSVQLGGLTGTAFDYITLKDVLYVPEASVNLFSVPMAVRRGIEFEFAKEGCRVSKGSQLITVAPLSGGVYVIGPSPGVAAALSAKATPQLWHRRYGHMGYDNMAKLQTDPAGGRHRAFGEGLQGGGRRAVRAVREGQAPQDQLRAFQHQHQQPAGAGAHGRLRPLPGGVIGRQHVPGAIRRTRS